MSDRTRIALDYLTRAHNDPNATPQLIQDRVTLARKYGATEHAIRHATEGAHIGRN